jgi:hypothetical protein
VGELARHAVVIFQLIKIEDEGSGVVRFLWRARELFIRELQLASVRLFCRWWNSALLLRGSSVPEYYDD